MKTTFRNVIMLFLAILFSRCSNPVVMDQKNYANIQDNFIHLKDTNRLWCYYYWIGDDISREGVTKDLEAMKDFGIGTALIGNINPEEVDGPVPLFSDGWWDIMVHAVREGKRLGIDIGNFNCPGWSQSGGPWVTWDKAMRYLVYSKTNIKGPSKAHVYLPKPADKFQDTYILAFQNHDDKYISLTNANATVSSKPGIKNPGYWLDNDMETVALFDTAKGKDYTINIKAKNTICARSILLYPAESDFSCDCDLYGKSETDDKYVLLKSFVFDRSNPSVAVGPVVKGPVAVSLPGRPASSFRLVCKNPISRKKYFGFSEIVITEKEILEKYIEKSLGKMCPTPFPDFYTYLWPEQKSFKDTNLVVEKVLDISDKMDKNGLLIWDVPEGEWTILRMGMTPTGTKNAPAAPQGKGYEIDKANEQLVRFHFNQYIAKIQERIPEESRSAFKYVVADSYEMGSENWTDGFEKTFIEKYGYKPVKYLPVLSGRVVGSVDESERFLWDLRRAIADEVAYQYVGGLRKVSNEHNLKLWLENYGHWGFPSEFLMYGGQSNLVSGEFWNEGSLGNIECKAASSATHIYGKPVTYAEAFTAAFQAYKRYPALLKKRGDWSFTEGINQFVLHLYIQQPDDKRIPGINAWFSTEFNRHNTWFKQGKSWADYIRRCQSLLKEGNYVADVCYFIGEDVPKMTGTRDPALPEGYSYDYINADVIMKRLSVKDGKFVLPDGMSYRIMVLPKLKTMRPEVLKKIEELVKQGGIILGPPPQKSPSLQNYPECDEKVRDIASKLWQEKYYVNGKLKHAYGKGSVLDGMDLEEVFKIYGIEKDVDPGNEVPVLWTHRTLPGMEIYFITNQSDTTISFDPSFRVAGLSPQLWDPVYGEIRKLNDFSMKKAKTIVPLKMYALQSYFIVFTNQTNTSTKSGFKSNFPDYRTLLTLHGKWTVDFNNKKIGPRQPLQLDSLIDWTLSSDNRIKYYSGTATYTTNFTLDDIPYNTDIFLNLGNVGVMAHAKLNGKDLGGTWISPFRLPIKKGLLKKGENKLVVDVVNIWRNRMVLDKSLPESERYTWTSVDDVKPGEKLLSSGLMGPVSIEMIR